MLRSLKRLAIQPLRFVVVSVLALTAFTLTGASAATPPAPPGSGMRMLVQPAAPTAKGELSANVATGGTVSPGNARIVEQLAASTAATLPTTALKNAIAGRLLASGAYPVAMATGPDNGTRVLWVFPNNSCAIYDVASNGTSTTSPIYGPYAGWTPTLLTVGPDNSVRVAWVYSDNSVSIWTISSTWTYTISSTYSSPGTGWSLASMAQGTNTRLLWDDTTSGEISIWTINPTSGAITTAPYGPITGWTAQAISIGGDADTRVLWQKTDGSMSLWTINAGTGAYTIASSSGPLAGWTPTAVETASNNSSQVLWDNANKSVSDWYIPASGASSIMPTWGPFTGWTPGAVTVGGDLNSRLQWTYLDGTLSIWVVTSSGTFTHLVTISPPVAPPSFVALPGSSQVTVYWDNAPNAVYQVIRNYSPTVGAFAELNIVNGGYETDFVDTQVSNGIKYSYEMSGFGGEPVQNPLPIVTVVPGSSVLPAPTTVNATLVANTNQATVSWSAVTGATGYAIWRWATSNVDGAWDIAATIPAGTLTYTDAGLQAGTQYYYTMSTINANGCGPALTKTTYPSVVAVGYPGSIYPKYQVIGVTYAPPGASSYVTYTHSTQVGASTSYDGTFSQEYSITDKVSEGFNLFGIDVTNTGTATQDYTQSYDSTWGFAVNQTTAATLETYGPASSLGLDHDADYIEVWLNPVLNFVVSPGAPNPVVWTNYYYDSTDVANGIPVGMDVLSIPVSYLNGHASIPAGVLAELDRTWAKTNADGSGPALTTADDADILNADPFTNPSYTISQLADGNTSDGRYYRLPNNVNYTPVAPNGGAQTQAYSFTLQTATSEGTTVTDVHKSTYAEDLGESVSIFGITLGADVTQNSVFTSQNKWSAASTTTLTNVNNLSITSPLTTANYSGPVQFAVYQDNIYGTFMFYPL